MAQLAVKDAVRPAGSAQIDQWTKKLLEEGYAIIPGMVSGELIDAISADFDERFSKTPFCEGQFYGTRTKRFGRLLARSKHAAAFVQHELILGIVERLLLPWCETIQLNLTQALEIHPGSPAQVPHRDQDMWMGIKGEVEYLVNVMWPITPYTRSNGATVVWPGSHRQQDEMLLDPKSATYAEMEPGSALLFLGSTLHGAGSNITSEIRRGMIISYCLGWLKPYENQWLAYPPEIARTFSRELAGLVGYRQHRPNLGNYEGQCPSILLGDDIPEHLHAVDELRPEQAEMVGDYMAGRLSYAA